MCLILFSINQHPKYKLIFLANRDEFHKRPTATAKWWTAYPNIIGGQDLEAKGTWLAMTKEGKIAAVTNFRNPANMKSNRLSRGNLVNNFLIQTISPDHYLSILKETRKKYNGYNLLFGNQDSLYFYSSEYDKSIIIKEGLHGLSNASLDDPWPKVENGKKSLGQLIKEDQEFPEKQAFSIMQDKSLAPDDQLPDTGIGQPLEKALSSRYIEFENYGTRCSTIITVDRKNEVRFTEQSYIPANYFSTKFLIKAF